MSKPTESNDHVLLPIQRLIAALQRQEFFGTVELKFEAGQIVLLRKTETMKPEDYRENRGANDEQQRT